MTFLERWHNLALSKLPFPPIVRTALRNLSNAQTARIRSKYAGFRGTPIEQPEKILLDLEVLHDRFDDQVGFGDGTTWVGRGVDVRKDVV